ncbi:MAG: nicotinamide-nucleotide amidohydrolase family protein [Nitrospirae bacterium]|nr:nicotinamide-nucleotide amidohydrolase family protein [Nitrospirota bacterium]
MHATPGVAHILITGSELVTGRVSDVNGPFLAGRLSEMGIPVAGITVVGDDRERLTLAIGTLFRAATLVVMSGGLGPTGDDLTRPVLAAALGVPLVAGPERDGRPPYPLPQGGEPIANPKGSAPGIWFAQGGRALAALPGVPWELRAMWPEVARRAAPLFGGATRHRALLRTVGLTEREVERRVRAALERHDLAAVEVGVSAKPLAVDVHLAAASPDTLALAAAAARGALGDHVFTETDAPLAQVVGDALRRAGKRVATAESCTGGALSAAFTAIAGASDYVDRGVVSYSNAAKVEALGVPEALIATHGAVSEPVARAMAEGLLARSHADIAVAVTGIAGPTGGTGQKPVGTVVMALTAADGTFCRTFHHMGDRPRVIQRSVTRALDLVRRHLLGGVAGLERDFPPG